MAQTRWEGKYHIVFAPNYRRKVIYKQIRADIGRILKELCARKGIEIIEAEACPDHIHMFVRIPPKYSVSEIMGYLKGKSCGSKRSNIYHYQENYLKLSMINTIILNDEKI